MLIFSHFLHPIVTKKFRKDKLQTSKNVTTIHQTCAISTPSFPAGSSSFICPSKKNRRHRLLPILLHFHSNLLLILKRKLCHAAIWHSKCRILLICHVLKIRLHHSCDPIVRHQYIGLILLLL